MFPAMDIQAYTLSETGPIRHQEAVNQRRARRQTGHQAARVPGRAAMILYSRLWLAARRFKSTSRKVNLKGAM